MYPVDFPARFMTAQREAKGVNCISATFFLLGLTDAEKAIHPQTTKSEHIGQIFTPLSYDPRRPLFVPDEAVAFGARFPEDDYYDHMGVIAPFSRSLVIQRFGIHHPISLEPLTHIIDEYVIKGQARFDFLKLNPDWYFQK